MCEPLPLPRCTGHARENMIKAHNRLDALTQEYDKIKNGRNIELKEQLDRRIDKARQYLAQKEQDYYSSPGGINELKEMLTYETDEEQKEMIRIRLELAYRDKEKRTLARLFYTRAKKLLSEEDKEQYQELKEYETESNKWLARVRTKFPANHQNSIIAHNRAQDALKKRKRFEEKKRREISGIEYKKVSIVDAGEVLSANLEKDQYFLPLNSEYFGRAKEYTPYGAYARITSIQRNQKGEIIVGLENKVEKVLSEEQRFLKAQNL